MAEATTKEQEQKPTRADALDLLGSPRGHYIMGRALHIAAQVHLSHNPETANEEAWQTEPSDAHDCVLLARIFPSGYAVARHHQPVEGKVVGAFPDSSTSLEELEEATGWNVEEEGEEE